VCDPAWVPAAPAAGAHATGRGARAGGERPAERGAAPTGDLDAAILALVAQARPAVGRTRAVEVLRGGRSKAVVAHAYDGLPAYGTYDHLGAGEVLERVDALLAAGRLRTTGGAYPKLELAGERATAA
jgi:ATP-dependent DNA helicase RecQ